MRQYDTGLGDSRQGVITLEPVYPKAGGDSTWVKWFMREFIKGESLAFNYTQAGQENSFTWDAMKKGLEIQMPLLAKLRNEGKIRVETMKASGIWFKKHFKVTPPTAFSVTNDLGNSDLKTVWFDSRFYRINLLWESGGLRVRDIHLFDERFPSVYTTKKASTNDCSFFTLPVVDGYLWSKHDQLAGLRFKVVLNGTAVLLKGGDPKITESSSGKLHISWPLTSIKGKMEIDMDEKIIKARLISDKKVNWYLDMTATADAKLPFKNINTTRIDCAFEGMLYGITAIAGSFSKPGGDIVFRISPKADLLTLDLSTRNPIN